MTLDPTRITTLLSPFLSPERLSSVQFEQVSAYLDLLLKWNSKINLTAVREPEDIVTRHFGEAFFAARNLLQTLAAEVSVVDVGSGAGFPGIPLKIWNTAATLTLVESNGKKATFLREVTRALKLDRVTVLNERTENISATADVVTVRAVERFEAILPQARRFSNKRGKLALLIGGTQVSTAAEVLNDVSWSCPIQIPLSENRVLLIGTAP